MQSNGCNSGEEVKRREEKRREERKESESAGGGGMGALCRNAEHSIATLVWDRASLFFNHA
jgi:hypothetical protein